MNFLWPLYAHSLPFFLFFWLSMVLALKKCSKFPTLEMNFFPYKICFFFFFYYLSTQFFFILYGLYGGPKNLEKNIQMFKYWVAKSALEGVTPNVSKKNFVGASATKLKSFRYRSFEGFLSKGQPPQVGALYVCTWGRE